MTNLTKIIIATIAVISIGAGYMLFRPAQEPVSDTPSVDAEQPRPEEPQPSGEVQENTPSDAPSQKPATSKTPPSQKTVSIPSQFSNAVKSPNPSEVSQGPVIITALLTQAKAGESYAVFINALGGKTPYGWKILSGALPPGTTGGLSVACADMPDSECRSAFQISGTPSQSGVYPFRLAVSDGMSAVYKDYTIQVNPATNLSIVTTSLPDATLGEYYQAEIVGYGAPGPYSWSIAGLLPPDLSMVTPICANPPCPARTTIIGTPRGINTYSFSVILTAGNQNVSKEFTITVKQ